MEETTVGEFIDKLKETGFLEVLAFILAWEETAPIFHGADYRLRPLAEDFVNHLFNEIKLFTILTAMDPAPMKVLTKKKYTTYLIKAMNKVIELVHKMAEDCNIAMGEKPIIPQIIYTG